MRAVVAGIFLYCFLASCFPYSGHAQQWSIEWVDNMAQMNMEQRYKIGPDSLIITGVADFGRTPVRYLERQLLPEERIALSEFISGFDADSLAPLYFHDYTGFQVISSENYPRSIDLMMMKNEKLIQSKATNCWVGLYARVANAINPLLPNEVRISYEPASFESKY
ncbi:MAG: hypothetical protein RLZZ630_1176 [Bacteroidota bacterium]|jgi:hypothetical protein